MLVGTSSPSPRLKLVLRTRMNKIYCIPAMKIAKLAVSKSATLQMTDFEC
jgi:hypothetical protein